MYRLDCGCVTEVTNDGRWQISEAREERHEYLWNQSSFVLCHYLSQMKSSSLLSYQTMKYKFNCISLVKFINSWVAFPGNHELCQTTNIATRLATIIWDGQLPTTVESVNRHIATKLTIQLLLGWS